MTSDHNLRKMKGLEHQLLIKKANVYLHPLLFQNLVNIFAKCVTCHRLV